MKGNHCSPTKTELGGNSVATKSLTFSPLHKSGAKPLARQGRAAEQYPVKGQMQIPLFTQLTPFSSSSSIDFNRWKRLCQWKVTWTKTHPLALCNDAGDKAEREGSMRTVH